MSRALLISSIACLATVSTQERAPVRSPGAQTPIFSSGAELVVAHVTVKDRQGAYVTSLPTNDATVFRAALAGAMGGQGRTAMYDAISNGLSYVGKGHHPRRVLVVVGDGGDNASTTTFDEVLKQAQRSNAAIYTVGIVDPVERDANPRLLKRLALATGGESFFPNDVNDVDEVFQRIADDIRHSYTLGYVSSNPARDGRFRRIRIVATDSARRSLRVRTRDGYRAGGPLLGS